MKTKHLLFIILLFMSMFSHAQQKDFIKIAQNFEVGKIYLYELQMTKYDSKESLSEKAKSFTQIEFRVSRENKGLKLCTWKYGSTRMEGLPVKSLDEKSKKLLNLNEGHEVKFTIDQEGTFGEITNYEECKQNLENTFKAVYAITTKEQKAEVPDKVAEILKNTHSTPEIMINTYYPDIPLFFNSFGSVLHSDSTYITETELANPLGGKAFPAKETLKISDIEGNIATIKHDVFIEPTILTKILLETMVELTKNSDKPFKKEDISSLPKLDMSTHIRYLFDFKNHIIKEVFFERKVEYNGQKKIKTYKIIPKN